jgi:hypothetical protein
MKQWNIIMIGFYNYVQLYHYNKMMYIWKKLLGRSKKKVETSRYWDA